MVTRPSVRRMLFRGVRRACPWCGGRHAFFVGWFHKEAHCRSCGLRWRRGDVGFELAALTWPDIAVTPMLIVLGAGAVILPILLYPVSYTLWQALDIAMRPVTVDDFDLLEPSPTEP
jgi:uncharacterized protein (DUF983 family)